MNQVPTPLAPDAKRFVRPGWRDPRIVAGLVIVAVSILVGSRLLASADDTRLAWVAGHDLAAGAVVDDSALVRVAVKVGDPSAGAYFLGSPERPAGRLLRPVAAGELVPRAAVTRVAGEPGIEVPLNLARADVPPGVGSGTQVDVWAVPAAGAGGGPDRSTSARRVLTGVRVVAAPDHVDAFSPEVSRTVVVLVDVSLDLVPVLSALAAGRPLITLWRDR